MKTLINKNNPEIRITATEITIAHPPISNEGYVYWIPAINEMYNPIDWTLEEEPVKEEICSKCVHHKDDDYCYYPHGGMRRRINENGVCECTAFWEREQEKPKRKQSSALKKIVDNMTEEKLAKTRAEMKTVKEEPQKVNCPFDKGDCRYCTVQFCGAREENQIETRSTVKPVDLEKEIDFEKEWKDYYNNHLIARLPMNKRQLARHFYELGKKGGSK